MRWAGLRRGVMLARGSRVAWDWDAASSSVIFC